MPVKRKKIVKERTYAVLRHLGRGDRQVLVSHHPAHCTVQVRRWRKEDQDLIFTLRHNVPHKRLFYAIIRAIQSQEKKLADPAHERS